MEVSPAGHGPKPSICALVARGIPVWPRPCREDPQEALCCRQQLSLGLHFGFLETSSPAQPEKLPRQIVCHCRGWNMVVVGRSYAGTILRLNFSGVHLPPNDPGSLHFSLFKDSTPALPLCAGLCSLLIWTTVTPALKPWVEWWGGATLWAKRVSERTLPIPLAAAVPVDNEHREVKGVLIAWWAFQGLCVLSTAPQRPPTQAAEDPGCGPAPSSQR